MISLTGKTSYIQHISSLDFFFLNLCQYTNSDTQSNQLKLFKNSSELWSCGLFTKYWKLICKILLAMKCFVTHLMKIWNWWVIYNWDHEQQQVLKLRPLYIVDDGSKIIHYLNMDSITQKLFKQMKISKTYFNLFIWNKTFKPKTEKMGQRNRSQRNKQTRNSILMLCRYSWQHTVWRLVLLSAQEFDSCSGW